MFLPILFLAILLMLTTMGMLTTTMLPILMVFVPIQLTVNLDNVSMTVKGEGEIILATVLNNKHDTNNYD